MPWWAKRDYAAKLADKRWQRVRRQVLERDGHSCVDCGTVVGPFHAHHTYYEGGMDPWDYPLDSIVTLCAECHRVVSGGIPTPRPVFLCRKCHRPVDRLSFSEANPAFCRDCLPDDCGKRFPDAWL